MVNKICFSLVFSCLVIPALADPYADFKQRLAEENGITYSLDISSMPQVNKDFSWQNMYHGSINWQTTHNLSFQAAYTGVKYFGKSATDVSNAMSVALPINDFPSNSHSFDSLSVTYAYDWVSVTLGQFPMYNFDGGRYNSNQQINFNNYSLSQNATQMYPVASLGGYVNLTPSESWSFIIGAQDATNLSGSKITTSGFDQKKITGFAYASYKPKNGQYNLLIYQQPSVDGQLENSWNWSFNAIHNFGKIGFFGALNGTTGRLLNVRQSYSIGTVYNNPFNRNNLDQIGFGYSLNKLNTDITQRNVENVLELYYDIGITKYFVVTPDIQLYIHPGYDREKTVAAVATLRLTAIF